jgi:hypothetical protein
MPLYQPPSIPGLTVSGGVVTINDNSADQDFRVESDDNTHMLYVDAGNDRVAVGTDTPLAPLHVSDSGAGDVLIIESTDAGATAAPDIVFYRNSASAATGDVLGRVEFRGRNAANNADISWAILEATAEDATGGGEDGRFTIKVTRQGSEIEYLQLGGIVGSQRTMVFNDTGSDIDFRVEGASAPDALFVEGSSGKVGIGTAAPAAPLHIVHSGTDDTIRLESTDAGTSLGPDLVFKRTTATPVNGDLIGSIRFLSMNSNQDDGAGTEAEHEFADIYARVNDITTGSESGELYFRTFMSGTQRKRLGLTLTETVFNQDGQDINLRIEGSGAPNALFVEGSSGNIGLGTATPASTLDVIGDVRFRASVEVCTSDPAAANIETGTVYQFTKGSAGVFTLPASPPVGTQFVLVNGDGQDIVITRPHSSVKINGATSNVTNTTAYAATSIIATVSNGNSSEWLVFGGI